MTTATIHRFAGEHRDTPTMNVVVRGLNDIADVALNHQDHQEVNGVMESRLELQGKYVSVGKGDLDVTGVFANRNDGMSSEAAAASICTFVALINDGRRD
jgi:hypothetical protein